LKAVIDVLRFPSTSPRGHVLAVMKKLGYEEKTIGMALGAFLKPEECRNAANNDYLRFDVIVAMAFVAAFEMAGDSTRLISLLTEIDVRKREWAGELAALKTLTADLSKADEAALKTLNESISTAQNTTSDNVKKFDESINAIRKKFEQEFALRTPM